MAVGQAALVPSSRGTLDVSALDAAEVRLEVRAARRCAEHGELLREVLELHRVLSAAGAGLSTVPQLGLLLQLSESAAQALLEEACLLTALPGAIEALDCGLLTVAQSAAFVRAVGHLDQPVQLAVWSRLQARLIAAFDGGAVLTPARLSSVLARWVVATDPRAAQDRRRAAEAAGDVSYRRRDDGVGDLLATGIPAPLLQAVLCRIRDAARPFGTQDERSAGKRRVDALTDMLLGRSPLTSAGACADPAGRPSCGCHLHAPVPCGADIVVHVPLGAALGTTDELAELVGHGPLHPDQLSALLLAAPRLRAVRVDERGVPVAVDHRVHRLERGDPQALRRVLLDMLAAPPGRSQPRHPFDHHVPPRPPGPREHGRSTGAPDRPGPSLAADAAGASHDGSGIRAGGAATPAEQDGPHGCCGDIPDRACAAGPGAGLRPSTGRVDSADGPSTRPRVRSGGHPAGTPGPYRLPARLRRLAQLRSPRCEWPACGVRAAACDLDHDRPWPAGATCACNVGPLCRRHHRVKQLLMQKVRGSAGEVVWTDPTGRRWTSPTQHEPPAPEHRTAVDVADPAADELIHLSPAAWAELLAPEDDDAVRFELRATDVDPDEPGDDRLAVRVTGDDGWGLVLADPYRWAA